MEAMAGLAGRLMNVFRDQEAFNEREKAAIQRVVDSNAAVDLIGGPKSEAGLEACSSFLGDLAAAAHTMGLQPAPRHYRESFTPNYQAIFPDNTRNYRVDVLEGCLDQPTGIYVNGDCFDLSAETLCCAQDLHTAWHTLGKLLKEWDPQCATRNRRQRSESSTSSKRQELAQAFQAFDSAWANLEHKYINELIAIEGKARDVIVQAIAFEKKLDQVEAQRTQLSNQVEAHRTLLKAQQDLVQSVGRLNSVSNIKRKGRDDLAADILVAAEWVANSRFGSPCALIGGAHEASLDAAGHLARDVLQSFEELREYLRQVKDRLECVDPHLCNNPGLVARLVDWEESWEVGQRYLTNEALLHTLCDLVSCIQRLQAVEPQLDTWISDADCDVGLFLALPRLLILRYLAAPEKQTDLLRSLLPHRFLPASGESSKSPASATGPAQPGPELAELVARFRKVRRAISTDDSVAWKLFAHAAIADERNGGAAATVVEEFMRDVEQWSVEVQRHCPEDWNQCSFVLVQCLSNSVRSTRKCQAGFPDV